MTSTIENPSDVGDINARRLESPGTKGWEKSPRAGSSEKYLVITVDSHCSEPTNVYELGGIDPEYLPRVPQMVVDDEGRHLIVVEGWDRPQLVKGRPKGTDYEAQWEEKGLNTVQMMWSDRMEPDDIERMAAAATQQADEPSLTRLQADLKRDGVDAALLFANRASLCWATTDDVFAAAASHAFNVWAWDVYGAHNDRFAAAAQLATADIDLAIKEVQWVASRGFRAINIPCKPFFGDGNKDEINYNHPMFDPLWAAIAETGIPVTMHGATGRDPRAATGSGGAILNKAVGFLTGSVAPAAAMLASGVFERFPDLKFVTVEADIGWIPWLLQSLDDAYYKHHMWVRPWLKEPPSHYWYTNCGASFIEDRAGLALAHDFDMVDHIMWSNDYPHHEGTWPHSSPAIERELQKFSESEREQLLGQNAATYFGFDPEKIRAMRDAD
jgi:predicted TIM-barrel fold metal-dependent hydrolase